MKTIIRNLKLWIIAVAAVASAACSDLLDQRPQGQWTIDDIEGGAYFSQVMALYTKARHYNITSGIPAFAVHYTVRRIRVRDRPRPTVRNMYRCTRISSIRRPIRC